MRLVIADTSPINYLLLIGHIDLFHVLFGRIVLPATVSAELGHPKAPPAVRDWIASPPAWVDIHQTPASHQSDPSMAGLDAGEEDAIQLALELHADLVLMDDEEVAVRPRQRSGGHRHLGPPGCDGCLAHGMAGTHMMKISTVLR